MNSTLKYFIYFILITLFVLFILPFLIPQSFYKNIIERHVNSLLKDSNLTIIGDVNISLIPIPTLILNDFKFAAVKGSIKPNLLEGKQIKFTLDFANLIKGNINLSSIQFIKPLLILEEQSKDVLKYTFNVETNTEGASKSDTTLTQKIQVGESVLTSSSTQNISESKVFTKQNQNLFFENLEIVDGKIEYYKDCNVKVINNVNLTAVFGKMNEVVDFLLTAQVAAQDLKLKGKISELKELTNLSLEGKLFEQEFNINGVGDLANNEFKGKLNLLGDTSFIKGMQSVVNYQLASNIKLNSNEVEINDLNLNIPDKGVLEGSINYNFKEQHAKLNIISGKGNISGDLIWNNAENDVLGGKLDIDIIEGNEIFSKFIDHYKQLSNLFAAPVSIKTNIVYGKQILILKEFIAKALNITIKGDLKIKNWDKDLTINYDFKNDETQKTIKTFNLTDLDNVKAKGALYKKNDFYEFNSVINLLGNDITIDGNINVNKLKPEFIINAKSNLLNLDKFSSSKVIDNAKTSSIIKKVNNSEELKLIVDHCIAWSNNKIDLTSLNLVDGNINIDLAKLTTNKANLTNVNSKVEVKDGDLILHNLTANLYGGTVESRGEIRQKGTNINLFIKANDINLNNITSQSNDIKIIKGKINGQAEISTEGDSVLSYISFLNGDINISGSNGVIQGINLDKILTALTDKPKPTVLATAIYDSLKGGETNFSKLEFNANINNGVIKINDCKIYANQIKATTIGNINLLKFLLDTTTKVQIKEYPPLDIFFTGPINNTSYTVNANAFINYVMKDVISSIVDNIKEGGNEVENVIKQFLDSKKNKDNTSDENEIKKDLPNNIQKWIKKGKSYFKKK